MPPKGKGGSPGVVLVNLNAPSGDLDYEPLLQALRAGDEEKLAAVADTVKALPRTSKGQVRPRRVLLGGSVTNEPGL